MLFFSTLTFLFFNYPLFLILFLYIPFLYFIPRLMCHSFTFLYIFFLRLPSCPLSFLFRFSLLQFYSVASICFCLVQFVDSHLSSLLLKIRELTSDHRLKTAFTNVSRGEGESASLRNVRYFHLKINI